MLPEAQLNFCLTLCCSNGAVTKHPHIFQNIKRILSPVLKKVEREKQERTPSVELMEFVYYLCVQREKMKGEYDFQKLNEGIANGKFRKMIGLLETSKRDFTEDEVADAKLRIERMLKFVISQEQMEEIESVITQVKSGNYADMEEANQLWDPIIRRHNDALRELEIATSVGKIQSIDLVDDTYEHLFNDLEEIHNSHSSIKSGFPSIDKFILSGRGFEPRRFYLIGGTSGVGKSAFLLNLLKTASMAKNDDDKQGVYLYISGENLIQETFERLYCCMTGTPYDDMVAKFLKDLKYRNSMETHIKKVFKEARNTVIVKYSRAKATTVHDIRRMIREASTKGNLKAVYIDYLDLFSSGSENKELRIELGQVALHFKTMAVEFSVPVISATQLNRTGYDTGKDAALTTVSESMQKVDTADFVIMLHEAAAEQNEEVTTKKGVREVNRIRVSTAKNRNGRKGGVVFLEFASSLNGKSIFNFRLEEPITSATSAFPGFAENVSGNIGFDQYPKGYSEL